MTASFAVSPNRVNDKVLTLQNMRPIYNFSFLTKKNIFNFVKFKMIWNESMKYPHV